MGCAYKSCLLSLCISNILSAQAYYGGHNYVWDFRGQSTKQDRITGEAPGGMFGTSVATVDLISAVGSPGYVRDAGTTGAVFVYHRKTKSHHEWSEEEFVVADDGEDGDMFGCAVDVSGPILMVGAMHNSAMASQSGAAYAYKRSVTLYNDGTWVLHWDQVAKLAPDELLAQDYFGSAVAIHRNTTVIGAHGRDDGGTFSGAVYVYKVIFDEDGEVEFEYDQKIVADEPTRYDMFGVSVGVHANFIIIGAPGVDYNGNTRSGAAYIFQNLPSKSEEDYYRWTEVDMLVVEDGAPEDSFGNAVAISGSTAVVGAEGSSHGGHAESGAAFVFSYYHDEWVYSHTLMTPNSEFDHLTGFGHAISIYKDTIVVSSHSDSGPGAVFGYNLIQPEKGNFLWQHSFSRVSSSDDYGEEFGKTISIFDGALVVGVPNSQYGSIVSFVSNSTVDVYSFIPIEEEYFLESFSLPDAAVALFAISGTVLVVFVFVKYGSAMKKFVSRDDNSPFAGDRGSLVAGYDDVDLDSEHSSGSIGLTAVEQHTFSSRNPLNNRF